MSKGTCEVVIEPAKTAFFLIKQGSGIYVVPGNNRIQKATKPLTKQVQVSNRKKRK